MVLKSAITLLLAVVLLKWLLLKLAAVVFSTVNDGNAGYVILLVIYLPLNMHGVSVVDYGSGLFVWCYWWWSEESLMLSIWFC